MQELCSAISRQCKSLKAQAADWQSYFTRVETIGNRETREKQKKLRALEIKLRDLSASRDYWKNRAKIAEEKLQTANIDTCCEKKRDSYKRASKLKNK